MNVDENIGLGDLKQAVERVFELSAQKIRLIDRSWDPSQGTPVFTEAGRYTSRGWTEWTQGFQFGCALLQYEAGGDEEFLKLGLEKTRSLMATHVSHTGVHDHGFNNVSTYGNLLRLHTAGRLPRELGGGDGDRRFYEMALKVSGAVQAARWTDLPEDLGYVYSFNGPHSLFADTIRSMRALVVAHRLGHVLMGERDRAINLLERSLRHAETTALYNVYFGEGRDAYDIKGRVVHESVFNTNDGSFRCPSSQQGYSPFTTWTRGHAWILCGYPEQLEILDGMEERAFADLKVGALRGKKELVERYISVSRAVADFYLEHTPLDGIPYWDTGAPGLAHMGDYLNRPAEPHNDHEPVDSSAAAIAAQGLIRLGRFLERHGEGEAGSRYLRAGLCVARRLFSDDYLSSDPQHQGLLLHSVYHRPNGWDHVPAGKKVPCGESSLWGDYHAVELALYIKKLAAGSDYRFYEEGR